MCIECPYAAWWPLSNIPVKVTDTSSFVVDWRMCGNNYAPCCTKQVVTFESDTDLIEIQPYCQAGKFDEQLVSKF